MSIEKIKEAICQYQDSQRSERAEANKLHGQQRHNALLSMKSNASWGRNLYLCYALLRGRTYREQEPVCREEPTHRSVRGALNTFGEDVSEEAFRAWVRGEVALRSAA